MKDDMEDHDAGLKGSAARLWSLIEERGRTVDRAAIDERIWDLFGETWTVMFTDLAGFSRQVEAFGIIHFLQVIHEQKQLFLPIVKDNDGILIKVEADSFLILFRRPERALRCAMDMQAAADRANDAKTPEEKILLCVGIGYGRILRIGDEDVFGAEVNASSKLGEDLAKAKEILVTDAVKVAVSSIPGLAFDPVDEPVPGSKVNWRVRAAATR
jgi:adenylate cyclase